MDERAQVDMVRVHPVAVECRMRRECHQFLGDEPLRSDQQLATGRLERGVGGLRPDQHTAAAQPVDRLDHQLVQVVQHVVALRAFGADPRRHLWQ
jgi:hypothetical protein